MGKFGEDFVQSKKMISKGHIVFELRAIVSSAENHLN